MKGVILFDLHNKTIFVSRNVTHYDHILPYPAPPNAFPWSYHTQNPDTSPLPPHEISDPSNPSTNTDLPHLHIQNISSTDDDSLHNALDAHNPSDTALLAPHATSPPHSSPPSSQVNPPSNHTPTPTLRRSTRIPVKPSHLSDYVCNTSTNSPSP
ncbi:retrovirus-related pol polyprotein from transposon TNT 1-94 [Trifolium medium]|uniref:Retrovirus-related pol polyprotein from transposon TNT 1-94 n=1 Tax=Trifolium medium TaxID=97028 RepID=A0A392Q534_9FABA|nr:retrovirus-related pol polyprotein from transposon TNT 1-94 [Trifolium medium]